MRNRPRDIPRLKFTTTTTYPFQILPQLYEHSHLLLIDLLFIFIRRIGSVVVASGYQRFIEGCSTFKHPVVVNVLQTFGVHVVRPVYVADGHVFFKFTLDLLQSAHESSKKSIN